MAQNITLGGSVSLTPAPSQVTLPGSYISSFDFLNQYLPDVAEKEFERYGNRSVSSFLRMVGAEMPCNSDLIKWSEQGRLHIKYEGVTLDDAEVATQDVVTINITGHVLRKGQTVMVSDGGSGATASFKGIITAVATNTIDVSIYDADGLPAVSGLSSGDNSGTNLDVFVYGSEFKKGSNGIEGSLEAPTDIKSNNPIIIKDKYSVSGSDMAQIGWIEVTTENGASGYLWYLKSEHETRLRFEDYLETAMVEAVPAETNSGAIATTGDLGNKGSEGLFYAIENGGNTSTGAIQSLDDIDAIVGRLDKQGSIEENVIFVNRGLSFEIDNVLAELNGFDTSGGAANAASFGLFDNDTDMALNLGFSGFRRGYDFYKSDWKYLNDATMRGGITGGAIDGVLVPAGSTTVYDQVLGKNAKRPFLHVRYKASQTEDRKMKSWIVGSAGGASNSDLDAMEVHFLSERALCTLGANNFFLFK
jgi:hypothetical protein